LKKTTCKINLKDGFSLMETLVWVAIVGVFVGLVGISGASFLNRAKVRACKQEMRVFSSALLDYMETEGELPDEIQGLSLLLEKGYVVSTAFKDPWGNPYLYSLISQGQDFEIKSFGADKKEGGTGINTDITISLSGSNEENTPF